jgi:glycosyltransferase involved in cell wall biosynthesis
LAETHEITLLCRLEENERSKVEILRPSCRVIHLLEFNRPAGPLQTLRIAFSYLRLGRMANSLLRRERFDLLQVEYIETGLGINRHIPIPSILIAHDELSKPARRRFESATRPIKRLTAYLYWRVIRILEYRICRKFNRILSASEQDRQILLGLDPKMPVIVLPHPVGIDTSLIGNASKEEKSLLFVGAMHRDVNIDAMRYFCSDILPLIRKEIPDIHLTIVGNEPPEEILRLAVDPGIRVTGFVEALEPYYEKATIVVSPIRIGGGVIMKNLDAMAGSCPVVTTSIGNEGISATPGEHLITADNPVEFAEAVLKLLWDEAERKRLAENGRAFAQTHFNLESSIRRLEEVYSELHLTYPSHP